MSSIRRIISSRESGRLSKGPITPEGKAISSQNALRHGLLSRAVVLETESQENFHELVTQHVESFHPQNQTEMGYIEDMAASSWRQRRLLAVETRMFDQGVDDQPEGDHLDRITGAFSALSESARFNVLNRYETRIQRDYSRALRNLIHERRLNRELNENKTDEKC